VNRDCFPGEGGAGGRLAGDRLRDIAAFRFPAALYESWTLPFSVLLDTPMAVFGAFAALWARHGKHLGSCSLPVSSAA
jgi:hypothetical protein